MALRRTIGSLVVRSQAYYLRRAAPSPPPSFSGQIIPYRSFAAPPQHAKKVTKDDDDDAGPRINDDITAPLLRLVTDEGHSVVPRHEALQLAARMGLDLVEVHRKTDPPVCKIMDFHKEKYNKDVKEKERLKTKSAIVLRGGDNKEVRFKAKTMWNACLIATPPIQNKCRSFELRKLKTWKVKADAITRLMERGYRVKCMAMPAGNEAEDLGGPLSQLLGLIQDVCIVESGPHLDSKHAYVIVRHVKFATKKGGKKASKAMEDAGKGSPRNTASESPATATDSGDETSEHGLEVENVDKTPAYLSRESLAQKERQDRGFGGSNRDNMDNMSAGGNRINSGQGGSQSFERGLGSRSGNSHMEKREKTNQDMVPEQTNRYASRRNQMGGDNQGRPLQDPRRNENEARYWFNDKQRPLEQPSPPSPRFSQGRPPQDPRRNESEARHRFNDNQRPLEQPSLPSPRFSQGRPPQDPRRNERESHVPSNNNQPLRFQQLNQNSAPRFQQSNQNSGPLEGRDAGSPTPTARSLGVLSSRTPATTSGPKKADGASAADKPSDTGPTKSFGIFSAPRK